LKERENETLRKTIMFFTKGAKAFVWSTSSAKLIPAALRGQRRHRAVRVSYKPQSYYLAR
jgi:hypothetical protein